MRRLFSSFARPSLQPCIEAGFTLVELMVTLSIAAILLAVGVPSMVDLIRDARLASQSDQLASTLNLARTEAIKQRTNIKVCPSATPNSDTSTACDAGAGAWTTGWIVVGTGVLQRNQATAGLTFPDPPPPVSVEFSGTLGNATAVSSFTLCMLGRKQHIVSVALSGHVSKSIGTTVCT
jgi:type IV fimbrial biogenesis protein FimT